MKFLNVHIWNEIGYSLWFPFFSFFYQNEICALVVILTISNINSLSKKPTFLWKILCLKWFLYLFWWIFSNIIRYKLYNRTHTHTHRISTVSYVCVCVCKELDIILFIARRKRKKKKLRTGFMFTMMYWCLYTIIVENDFYETIVAQCVRWAKKTTPSRRVSSFILFIFFRRRREQCLGW